MSFVLWLQAHWGDVLTGASAVVAAASVIVKLTPTLADDHALAGVMKLMSFLALNKAAPIDPKA